MPHAESYFTLDDQDQSSLQSHDSGSIGMHSENLYDLDERTDGALLNEADGSRYDNSTFTDESLFEGADSIGHVIDIKDLRRFERKPAKLDAADQWLLENDPSYRPKQLV